MAAFNSPIKAMFRRQRAGETWSTPRFKPPAMNRSIPLAEIDQHGWTIEQREDQPRSWMLYIKGIGNRKNRNTWIHARGQIPLERPLHRPCREANILWLYREWFLSVCLDYGPMGEALPPHAPANVVGFDLLDDFAVVNGITETRGELADATAMQTHIDRLKRERDATKDKDEKRRIKLEIIPLLRKRDDKRSNALHVWTHRLVARSGDLTVIKPDLTEHVQTPHGNPRDWGANTEIVSDLNRMARLWCPAMAIRMLAPRRRIRASAAMSSTMMIRISR